MAVWLPQTQSLDWESWRCQGRCDTLHFAVPTSEPHHPNLISVLGTAGLLVPDMASPAHRGPDCPTPQAQLVPACLNRRNVRSVIVGESRGAKAPLVGALGYPPEPFLPPFQKGACLEAAEGKGDAAGWFGAWPIAIASRTCIACACLYRRNVRSQIVGVQRGESPFGGGTGGYPPEPFHSPFQKGKGDTGGWFGAWPIAVASQTRVDIMTRFPASQARNTYPVAGLTIAECLCYYCISRDGPTWVRLLHFIPGVRTAHVRSSLRQAQRRL